MSIEEFVAQIRFAGNKRVQKKRRKALLAFMRHTEPVLRWLQATNEALRHMPSLRAFSGESKT